jgi:HD domain
MGREGDGATRRAGYLPRVVLATLVVTVLPGLFAAFLQASGTIHGWLLSATVAVVVSMALGAAGSAWWTRRPASRDIVFADLMLWGWLRRVWTERRLASARGLLGRGAELGPARNAALLEKLSSALESRDLYTHGHSRRVTRHSHLIARQLGLSEAEAARIRTAAALHDVGKIDTPRDVLNKPGRLSDEEFALVKLHPVRGAELVAALGDDELTAMVRHHHERLDGDGYPDGLSGRSIALGARVIAVADTFDALTSNRPYRSGCRHKQALDVLRAEAGTQLDPEVVSAFLSYYSGRRVLPWWSALAEGPSRFAAWLMSGVQGATAAPLGGGATSLGAAFLVGASLAGPPAAGEAARAADATVGGGSGAVAAAAPEPAVAPGSAGVAQGGQGGSSRRVGRVRSGTGRGRGRGGASIAPVAPAAPTAEPGGMRAYAAPGAGGGDPALATPVATGPAQPDAKPDVVDVKRPRRLAELADETVPKLDVPALGVRDVDLPAVKLPAVKLPAVEVPAIGVPQVDLRKLLAPADDSEAEKEAPEADSDDERPSD